MGAHFRRFFALHHLLVPAWVILLVVHGANDWVGLGFPLVLLVAGIPMLIYAYTRLHRTYRSLHSAAKDVGVEKSRTNRLLRLEVELAPGAYRQCQVGEFAYINVPSLARTEWHPFTISRCPHRQAGSVASPCALQAVVARDWVQQLGSSPGRPSWRRVRWSLFPEVPLG